nr:class I SAM-dependent methyltransferase [Sphingomonas sp. SCN 67-18]
MPPADANLKDVSTHFGFGDNWKDYIHHVDADIVAEAEAGILEMVDIGTLQGARFLDIGSGSGIHSLAALQLGVRELVAMDIDPASVEATSTLLARAPKDRPVDIREMSIFDATPENMGLFDVVYSWGVLHHTGAMWQAVEQAAKLVKPGGTLALALYQKRAACGLWTVEKRFYTRSGPRVRGLIRKLYKAAFFAGLLATGRSPARYVREYRTRRGMNFDNDIHDWLGGYPYESATCDETRDRLTAMGFTLVKSKRLKPTLGILGTGCAEYTFVNHVRAA